MSQETTSLTVYAKEANGKGPARRTRMKGMVPGVVYGPQFPNPFSVSFHPNDIIAAHGKVGRTGLLSLKLAEGAPKELEGSKVLLKEIDVHPYKTKIIHVDLHAIDLTKKIRVTVPVSYEGKAKGIADGGILNVTVREVEVRCSPDKIPSQLTFDISQLGIGDSAHLSELEKQYSDLEFIYDNDLSLLMISETREEKAADDAPATDAAAAEASKTEAPKE